MSIASTSYTIDQTIRDCRFLRKTKKKDYKYELSFDDLRRVFEANLNHGLDGVEFGMYHSNEVEAAVQRYLRKAYYDSQEEEKEDEEEEETNVELTGTYLILENDKWMTLGLKEDRAVLVHTRGVSPSRQFIEMLQKFFKSVKILETKKPSWDTGNHAILALENCITLRDHFSQFGCNETAPSELLPELCRSLRRDEIHRRLPKYNENKRIYLAKRLLKYDYELNMKLLDQHVTPKTTVNRHFRDDTADSNSRDLPTQEDLASNQHQYDERLSDVESIPEQQNFDRDDEREHPTSFDAMSTVSEADDDEERSLTVQSATTSKFRCSDANTRGQKQSSATKAGKGRGKFWKPAEKTNLIHFLVKQKGFLMTKLKKAREHRKLEPTAKRYRLPPNFWKDCSQYLRQQACIKTPKQCVDEAYVVSRIAEDDLIGKHGLSKEEAKLMYNLFSRGKRNARVQSRRMPVQPIHRQQNKARWDIIEEMKLLHYLVRNKKETLKMMNDQKSFPRFWHDCADYFHLARSDNAYRMRSVILSGLPAKILRTKYELISKEIELLQGDWRPNGGQTVNNERMKLVEKLYTC